MMVSDTFNPYSFYETGSVQSTTRFAGEYLINEMGNYVNAVTLNNATWVQSHFYANENKVRYNDGVFIGLSEQHESFYEY